MEQIKSKTILAVQTDGAVFADSLARAFCAVSSSQESAIIVDLRNSKSSLLWPLYSKNVKFIDDIIDLIADINLSVFKTYADAGTVFCIKDKAVLNNKNLPYFFDFLSRTFNNVFVVCDSVYANDNLPVQFCDVVLFPISDNPVSFEKISHILLDVSASAGRNINATAVVFVSESNFPITSCENTVFKNVFKIPFGYEIQKDVLNKNFMFSDVKHKFVSAIINLNENLQQYAHKEKDEISSIYGQKSSYISLKERLHKDLIKYVNESKCKNTDEIKNLIVSHTDKLLNGYDINLPYTIKQQILKELCDDIAGLGVLEDFINDSEISEIMVNGTDKIYVEKRGKIVRTDIAFQSQERLKTVIDRIAMSVGRHIDDVSPIVDARLKDGSRVNAVISPISLTGHILTIRKFAKHKLLAEELISYGSITKEMTDFLETAVKNKKNILISGGTGTGKTTLLNVLSSFINNDERIITIEDSAELQLNQQHVVRLESRPKSTEGTSEITIRQLVKNALRMRPDRIVVGECRSGETLDMLQAMNTGHNGSMTTVHSNSPHDAVSRLLVMSLMSGIELPEKAIISMIISAIDIIVQIKRYEDGSRKVREISIMKKTTDATCELVPLFQYDDELKQFVRKTDVNL